MEVTPSSSQTAAGKRSRQGSFSQQVAKRGRTPAFRAVPNPALAKYLRLRGTPYGVYEITRTLNFTLGIGDGTGTNAPGFNFPPSGAVGTAVSSSENFCMIFTPQDCQLVSNSGTVFTGGTIALQNASEIAAIWDEIKIDKVEVTLMGCFSQVNSTGNNAQIAPAQLYYATDDNSTDSSLSTIVQQTDCEVWYPNNAGGASVRKITVKPKFNTQIYFNNLTSAYSANRGYVQTGISVPHYGLLIALKRNFTNPPYYPNGTLNVAVKYYFKCKSLK